MFMPSLAAHSAVALVPAPHQMRSRRPAECGSRRSRPGGFGNIGLRVRPREALALQHLEEHLGVAPRHLGIAHPLGRRVTEVAPAVDHLFGRAAADAELQAPAGDQVGGAGVLRHVHRVLVAHVDDRGADLDPLGPRAARRRAAGTASRAGGRSDAPGNRRRRRRAPRPRRRGRSIAAARRTPCASATAATASNGRRRGSRFFSLSWRVDAGMKGGRCFYPTAVVPAKATQ